MPVLPEVGSTSTPRPGAILPCASRASIIATPMRSLTLEIGLKNSSLARRCAPTPFSLAIRSSRTSGVSPIVSVIEVVDAPACRERAPLARCRSMTWPSSSTAPSSCADGGYPSEIYQRRHRGLSESAMAQIAKSPPIFSSSRTCGFPAASQRSSTVMASRLARKRLAGFADAGLDDLLDQLGRRADVARDRRRSAPAPCARFRRP